MDQTIQAHAYDDSGSKEDVVLIFAGDRAIGRVVLKEQTALIGRAAECTVRLEHAMVSRAHARLNRAPDGRWRVVDLGSHNGTSVDGKPIQTETPVEADSQVGVGPFVLRLELSAAPIGESQRFGLSDEAGIIRTLREIAPPKLAMAQLKCLDDFSRGLLAIADPDHRLTELCQLLLHPTMGGRWAVAVSVSATLDDPVMLCPLQKTAGTTDLPRLPRGLIRAARSRHEPVLATNTASTSTTPNVELSIGPDVMTMAAVALPLHDGKAAIPARQTDLLCAAFPPEYGTGEWLALCALAVRHYQQAEGVWANITSARKLSALEADLERARRVQERLVPKTLLLPGLDLAIQFRPCHGVAGDYVDAILLRDGRSLLVIADVSGKGLAAAMVAMGLHTVVHAAARRWTGLADLAADLDSHLVESLPPDTFVTLMAVVLDPKTGAMEIINAGHPPASVVDRTGRIREVPGDGDLMLGPFAQTLQVMTDSLADDETMMLFTDGCFELFDAGGAMLGPAGLFGRTAMPIANSADSHSAAEAVIDLLDTWQGTGEASDDRTLLMVRRTPAVK